MLGKTALRLVGTGAETTGEGMVAIAGGHSVTCMQGGGRNGAEATPAPGKDSRDRDPPRHTHTREWERRRDTDPFNCVVRNRL